MATAWWNLFGGDGFVPHGQSYLWAAPLLWLFVAADFLSALACFAISIALVDFFRQRRDLELNRLLLLAPLALVASGTTHLISIVTTWQPLYWLEAWAKGLTALASVATAAVLWTLLPRALRIPSPKQSQQVIDSLETEVAVREKAEAELARLNETLESRVAQRTAELELANVRMQQEIVARIENQSELYAENERALVTLKSIADGAITTDVAGFVTSMNPVAERMTGWSEAEAVGTPIETVFRLQHEHSQPAPVNPVRRALETGEISELSNYSMLVNRMGRSHPVEDSAAPIRDFEGNSLGAVLVFRDVGDARKMADRMSYLAQHDFLTDLPNRVLLTDRLGQAVAHAQRNTAHAALMFLDLDNFKTINDTLGHAIGDQLLQEVARRLLSCVRGSDTVSRQGGDEFVILLPNVANRTAPAEIAEKLLQAASRPCFLDQHELRLTFSIGIAVYPEDGVSADALLKSADAAMYRAKAAGKGNYQFYARATNARISERADLETSLRRALKRGEFFLHYQPKISLTTGAIVGSEALLRWQHPELGMLEPGEFVRTAEEAGLIGSLGSWVVQEVCRQNLAWQLSGLVPLPIAVNLSVMQLKSRQFLGDMARLLAESHLDPKLLEFEVTESIATLGRDDAITWLRALKDIGVGLSVDNFGTCYSSLSYLKRLPIDKMQIDQTFVRDIATDPDDAAIIAAIINLSHSLKLLVIAEGIETIEQLNFLKSRNCDLGQGFLFSHPLPAEEFGKLLAERRTFSEAGASRPL